MKAKSYILLPFWAIALMLMVFTGCAKDELIEPITDTYMEKGLSSDDYQLSDDAGTRGGEDLDTNDGITDDEDDEDDSQRSTNR